MKDIKNSGNFDSGKSLKNGKEQILQKPSGVQIYIYNLQKVSTETIRIFSEFVSDERRKMAERFRYREDAHRCICSGALARYALGRNGVKKFFIRVNDFGKPYLKDRTGLPFWYFNISHSGCMAAAAVAAKEIGIDIEQVKAEYTDAVCSCCTSKEREYILSAAGNERTQRAAEIWTMKESYCKYTGYGLSAGLNHFTVSPVTGGIVEKGKYLSPAKVTTFKNIPGYYLSVCSELPAVSVQQVSTNELLNYFRREYAEG